MAKKQKFPHLLGSKWTAQNKVEGWRHFQVMNRKNQGTWVFAEIVAACDPTVRLWVNARSLQDRSLWQPGWQPLPTNSSQPDPSEPDGPPLSFPRLTPPYPDSPKISAQEHPGPAGSLAQ